MSRTVRCACSPHCGGVLLPARATRYNWQGISRNASRERPLRGQRSQRRIGSRKGHPADVLRRGRLVAAFAPHDLCHGSSFLSARGLAFSIGGRACRRDQHEMVIGPGQAVVVEVHGFGLYAQFKI